MTRKRCTRCQKQRVLTAFTRNRAIPDGFSIYCKPCSRTIANQRARSRKQRNLCYTCGSRPRSKKAGRCDYCRSRDNANQAQRHQKNKDQVYAAYGGYRCTCCGETAPEFLSVDHIDGSGAAHRKHVPGSGLYRWLIRNNFPKGFRILCMNCNFAIGHSGYCPHEKLPRKAHHGTQT